MRVSARDLDSVLADDSRRTVLCARDVMFEAEEARAAAASFFLVTPEPREEGLSLGPTLGAMEEVGNVCKEC